MNGVILHIHKKVDVFADNFIGVFQIFQGNCFQEEDNKTLCFIVLNQATVHSLI